MTAELTAHHHRYVAGLLHDYGSDQHYRDDMTIEDTGARRLAQLIKAAREDLEWTQDDLAREARVSRPTVQRYETGKSRNPEHEHLRRIFLALKLDPRELPIALGLVTRDELATPPARTVSSTTERVIDLLEDSAFSEEEKQALIHLLEARQQAQRGSSGGGSPGVTRKAG